MKTKMLEVRDRITFIVVMATRMVEEYSGDVYLVRRAGFHHHNKCVGVTWIEKQKTCFDYYDWGDRTMSQTHKYIEENWDELESGEVVDVEYILEETKTKKVSERLG